MATTNSDLVQFAVDADYESPPRYRRGLATPYVWRDPRDIPPRRVLYGRHYARQFLSTTAAPGGVGKSSLCIVEAIAMATGRPLLGVQPRERARVWYWNGEDPLEEIERRIAAVLLHYRVPPSELDGHLFVDSGRKSSLVIAEQSRTGLTVAQPLVDAMIDTVSGYGIDVVILDPFVSTHRVSENDNMAIDLVAKQFAKIADATNCAMELVHHVRKTGGNAVTVEDARGAVALLAAARSARVLNAMSADEASKHSIENRRMYFSLENGKSNMAPPPDKADWFRLVSVPLGNGEGGPLDSGDHVAAVTQWKLPDPLADLTGKDAELAFQEIRGGRWREHHTSKDWVGVAVARALNLDVDKPADRNKIKAMLRMWLKAGSLQIVEEQDGKRMTRKFVKVAGEDE